VHCLGLAPGADFGRDPRISKSWRNRRNFVFFVGLAAHDFTDFRPTNFTKFKHKMSIGVAMNPFLSEQNFENFSVRGRFSKKRKNEFVFNVLRLQTAITPQ